MTHRVVLATRDQHKVAELRRILESSSLDVDLVGTESFPELPDVAETGSTFAANASGGGVHAGVLGWPGLKGFWGLENPCCWAEETQAQQQG